MTQYNTLNVKLSNSQFNKLKSGIKNGAGVTLSLTDAQVLNNCKAFANGLSANIKFSKTHLSQTSIWSTS